MKRRLQQRLSLAKQDFEAIESSLGESISAYQTYRFCPEGFWQAADYEDIKQEVIQSFDVDWNEPRDPADYGRRLAYLIDYDHRHFYINVTRLDEDPDAIDWVKIKHFEEWRTANTPVDQAIAAYKQKLELERMGKPAPKWWQFWLIK